MIHHMTKLLTKYVGNCFFCNAYYNKNYLKYLDKILKNNDLLSRGSSLRASETSSQAFLNMWLMNLTSSQA